MNLKQFHTLRIDHLGCYKLQTVVIFVSAAQAELAPALSCRLNNYSVSEKPKLIPVENIVQKYPFLVEVY
jgi:hypothetical protein